MPSPSPDLAAAMAMIYTTWPDASSAREAAATLLSEKRIACANILAPMEAVFVWEGELQAQTEIPVLFKTSRSACARLAERIAELHPYDEPAIVSLRVDEEGSSKTFLAWVCEQTGQT